MYRVATDLPRGAVGLQEALARFLPEGLCASNYAGSHARAGARWGCETIYITDVLGRPLTHGCLRLLTDAFGGAPLL